MPTVAFLEAFNRHDIDAIMSAMTEDTVFIPSSDARIEGQEAVREVFASYPAARAGRTTFTT